MRKLISAIPTIILVCFSIWAWQPTFAGTWQDDFEDGGGCEWEILDVDPQVEKWWIDNGEAVGEIFQPGLMSVWFTGEPTWKNYSLSCRAKLVKAKDEPSSIGLMLHAINEENARYLFFIDYVFDTVRIVKAVQDDWFPVIYPFDAEIDTWYELTATVHEDGRLEFQVDDEIFTVIDDDPLKGGQAGLVVADGQARFDSVEITGSNISDNRHETDTPFGTAASHNTFKLLTDAAYIEVGDLFTLNLIGEKVSYLAGWQADIIFDPAILRAIEVSEGNFLKAGGTNTFFHKGTIDNSIGKIAGLSAARLGGDAVHQSDTLLSITFMAQASGTTCLALSRFEVGNSGGNVIPSVPPKISIVVSEKRRDRIWDVNGDGAVNILDMTLIAQEMGKSVHSDSRIDVNNDGTISILDLILIAQHLDKSTVPAAPAYVRKINGPDPRMIQMWIAQAQIENDGSIVFQRGIANLQNLLASLMPKKTVLLANYPNPFNPETWIPYQLAEPAEVKIAIYAADGTLVRTLSLGHQAAGTYQNKDRAAYWDGTNAQGEPVASGLYFYTLKVSGEFTATRKMLIQK